MAPNSEDEIGQMRREVSGSAGASAALALLDDVQRHRLRRAALHMPPRRSERSPS